MNRLIVAAMLFTIAASSASAGWWDRQDSVAMQPCTVEVLHSEMIPVGPLFHDTIRATLLVSPQDQPPFETTVQRVVPVHVLESFLNAPNNQHVAERSIWLGRAGSALGHCPLDRSFYCL